MRESSSPILDARPESIDLASTLDSSPEEKRSEAYLAVAQRLTQTGSWAASPRGDRGTYWSDEMFRIFERPASEGPLDRWQLMDLIHPDDREKHSRVTDEGLRGRTDWFVEFRILLPDQRVKHLHAIGHPILDERGDVRELVGAIVDVTERLLAQQNLEQSQLELRNAVEAIPAMAWMAHPDGTNAFVNRRWADYVGLPAGQTHSDAWVDVVHPDDLPRCAEHWARCVETGEPFEEELRLRRVADGRYRWFLDRGVPLVGNDGEILKWYGIATDIHDRKQAESLLAAEKRLLQMIATGAPLDAVLRAICVAIEEQQSGASASILMLNSEGTHLNFVAGPSVPDDAARAMMNLPVGPNAGPCGTAVHRRASVFVPDVTTDAFWNTPFALDMARRHSIRASWSTPILSPKGNVLGTVGIYCREAGGPSAHDSELLRLATYIAGVAIDRDRSEQALRRSEAYLSEAERLAHTGSWARAHEDGRWIYWSGETFRIFGLDPATGTLPPSAEFFELIHGEDRERYRAAVATAVSDKRDYELEYRVALRDGTVKYFHDIGHPIIDASGAIVEWVGTTVDVTERKLREQERDRARRLESEREAAIAHERSRLAGEIHDTLAQGLAMIVMQVADVEAKLGSTWALAARPLSTIRELAVESLAFARRSLNTLRVPTEMAGLAVTLEEVVERLRRHFDGSLSLSVTGAAARMDPAVESALAGIAREALTNAVKHSAARSIVAELEFMESGGVRVVVSDDGIGFDANTVRADAYGLVSMQERASRADVALTFVTEQSAGTTIVASWPSEVRTDLEA